jgi:hypothetical protein
LRPISLNIFQRLTRDWDALHPYNAAQLMLLDGPADTQRIAACWRSSLIELGLGTVRWHRRLFRYQTPTVAQTAVPTLDPATCLDEFLTVEMNRPFDEEGLPFRPFILPSADKHYLGIVYHHWVADSVSIRALLREWFFRLHFPARARRSPFYQPQQGYWRQFGPEAGNWDLPGATLDLFRWSSRLKRVRRVENRSFPDLQTRFTLHKLPDGLIDRLLPVAREAKATLNDVFLAAMAMACDRYVASPPTPRRSDLALGVIADLRGGAMVDTFGLFLGFTNVLCGIEQLRDWNALLTHIARQNRAHKASAAAQSSIVRMLGGRIVGAMLSRKGVLEFYRKRIPLAAGISNVNLNRSWVAEFHPRPILDYIRVSPTGPMLPVVFTPTTLGRQLHFGLTHRVSILPPDQAELCAREFASRLERAAP